MRRRGKLYKMGCIRDVSSAALEAGWIFRRLRMLVCCLSQLPASLTVVGWLGVGETTTTTTTNSASLLIMIQI
jgi:hypothetical protein